jgi:hypothetical protein
MCIQTKTSGHEPDCPTANLVKVWITVWRKLGAFISWNAPYIIILKSTLCNGKSVCIQTKTSGHEPDCPTANLVKVWITVWRKLGAFI